MTADMKDLVVILPGILGSVLQKDDRDLWNVSGQAIWQVAKSLGGRLQDLKLERDDPDVEDLGDGIRATGIMSDAHLIPGFWKIDDYTKTSQLITNNFKVVRGYIYQDTADKTANLAFHRDIEATVKNNHSDRSYRPYATVPFVGVQQPTLQSAELKEGKITVSHKLPSIMRNRNLDSLADGDGTVPKISAFPIEFGDRDTLEIPGFIAEAHGSLQNQPAILLNLLNKLRISQASGGTLEDIRGRGSEKSRSIKADSKAISVLLEDLYLRNEPIVIKAKVNPDSDGDILSQIYCVSDRRPEVEVNFFPNSDGWWSSDDLSLEPGLYRIKVATKQTGETNPNPVNDLFEVAEVDS